MSDLISGEKENDKNKLDKILGIQTGFKFKLRDKIIHIHHWFLYMVILLVFDINIYI